MDQWPRLHNNLSDAILRPYILLWFAYFHILYMHANRHATKWDNGLCDAIIAKHVWITVVGTPNHQVFQQDKSHPTGSGELDLEQYAYTALTGSCESRPLKRLNTSAGSPLELGELYLRVKQWFWGSFGGKETNSKPQLAKREYSLHIHPCKTLPRD